MNKRKTDEQTPMKSFHLHLVSDASGETLTMIAKAATVQYSMIRAIHHVHPLVRTRRQLDEVVEQIRENPGIVLYTIVNADLGSALNAACKELGVPCIAVLEPILNAFGQYLGTASTPVVAGQHVLDADYFRRVDAMQFSMMHDDGQNTETLDAADIVLVGVSRTSKTPTSIYLANRGYKTANVSLVPDLPVPPALKAATRPLIVGLIASAERIAEIRRNRVMSFNDRRLEDYVDMDRIKEEIAFTRRLCHRHGWPIIDVSRRSIEETAAAIIRKYEDHKPAPATGETRQ
jgi:[pyruvate, water dikinase]-phosphate phosphotransferase / [pyruvate, water dikinase] kinase